VPSYSTTNAATTITPPSPPAGQRYAPAQSQDESDDADAIAQLASRNNNSSSAQETEVEESFIVVSHKARLLEMYPQELHDEDDKALCYIDLITQDFAINNPVRFNGGGYFEESSITSLIRNARGLNSLFVIDPHTNARIPVAGIEQRIQVLNEQEVKCV
jgi:hypothetical protein